MHRSRGMPSAFALGLGDVCLKLTRPIAPLSGVGSVLEHVPSNQLRFVLPTCGYRLLAVSRAEETIL